MAITDAGQICESLSTSRVNRITLSAGAKAGSLLAVGAGGKRAASNLSVSSITDSEGNAWDWEGVSSTFRPGVVAWTRTAVPVVAGDWIEVTWNATPDMAWVTGHAFEGASGVPTDRGWATGNATSPAAKTVNVAGSDFLVLSFIHMGYDFGVATTPLNSMTEQDTHNAGSTNSDPQMEFLSRNHTSGSTFQAGSSLSPTSIYWSCVAVSFPFQAMPTSRASMPFLLGV